jgi:hypothetical protein
MGIQQGERLTLNVHLLAEPCLWCWEIIDREIGTLVEGSWPTEWTGYESLREASRAGFTRLTDLIRSTIRSSSGRRQQDERELENDAGKSVSF